MAVTVQNGRPFFMKMATLRSFLLGLCILQLCCFNCINGCKVFEHPLGNVTDDQEIEVGSTLTFQCTLFNKTVEQQNISSSDIILKLKKTPLLGTRIIDKYTVEYKVWNATVEDTGMYNCYVPHKNYSSPQLVCSSYIAVGFKPLDVHNFSCISLGYSNLTCSWVPPFNPVKTTYKLSDYLYDNEILSRQCPVQFSSSCQFRLDTKPAYIQTQNYLNFIVRGNNSLGNSKQHFRIKHSEIIKPAIPIATTEDVSETSLFLRLGAPRGLQNGEFSGGLLYSVKYYSISSKLSITQDVTVEAESNTRLMINDLVPHTQYRFEVRCRLNFPGDHFYWSDIYNATEITFPDVPYLAPIIDNSGFDVQVIAGNRTITLYWKAVPSEFENGNDFHYIIKYHEHYVPTRAARQASRLSGFSIRVDNKTSHSFDHMDTGTAYMFKVIAANHLGNSSNETGVIVVDKAEKFLPGPKDITVISYGQGSYDISWKTPDVNLTNFTLYWCETLKSRPAKCDGPIDWTSIVDKTSHQVFLPSNFTNYQFAVATVHNHKTSGMFWAPCTVLYGVTYKIRKIELVPKNSTSLRVRWPLKCEAEKKIIKEYAVYYCPFDGKCIYENARNCRVNGSGVMNWPHQVVTNTSQTEYILGPLNPFTCYFSYIRVRTDAGWGENSDFVSEVTMSSAPSGPPTDVYAVAVIEDSKAAAIKVSFNSPKTPNGIITRYKIFYNKTLSEGATFHKEVRVQAVHNEVILEKVFYYANYSIEVCACVDQACSEKSDPVYVYTGISRPGIISLPRVEILGSFVNITWESPNVPNGPIEFYQLRTINNDTNTDEISNVTGQNFFAMNRDCKVEEQDFIYSFKVRAVNILNGVPLYGDYSGPASSVICPSGGLFAGFNAGIIVGVVLGSIFVLVALFYFARYFLRNINEAKKTKIKLPKGLESPLDVNPLSSYDKFKSGLQNSRDSGIPNDRVYDRLFSSSSDGDLKRADELAKRSQTGRNPSGESNASCKGPDSISSANTTKTHNSLDSGAEVESPPSPDSFSSDSTTNTTPRIFKPGLRRVSEGNRFGSRDSGLARDDSRPINVTNFAMTTKGRCFDGEDPPEVNYIKYKGHLSNSDPSVAEYEVGNGSEPLMNPTMQPYTKYGESRSAENGLNSMSTEPGYSKYGLDSRQLAASMVPQHPQVFSAITTTHCPVPSIVSTRKDPPAEAYSKFGEVPPSGSANAYMSVNDFMNSAKVGATSHKEQEQCKLPGQSLEPVDDDRKKFDSGVKSQGYTPVEVSYPEVFDNPPETSDNPSELESNDCDIDLSKLLRANLVYGDNREKSVTADSEQSNGQDGLQEITLQKFPGGGRLFYGKQDGSSEESQLMGKPWCVPVVPDCIHVDQKMYSAQFDSDLPDRVENGVIPLSILNNEFLAEQPIANEASKCMSLTEESSQTNCEVLTDQPVANGYSPFTPLNSESNISPTYVLTRPNLANVPVKSV